MPDIIEEMPKEMRDRTGKLLSEVKNCSKGLGSCCREKGSWHGFCFYRGG